MTTLVVLGNLLMNWVVRGSVGMGDNLGRHGEPFDEWVIINSL